MKLFPIPQTILLLIALSSCGRTPSRERFSIAMDIEIPEDVEVLKDKYDDMLQDYVITYHIKLKPKQFEILRSSIKSSVFYDSTIDATNGVDHDHFISNAGVNGIWARNASGYVFINDNLNDLWSAVIDTTSMEAIFIESHD